MVCSRRFLCVGLLAVIGTSVHAAGITLNQVTTITGTAAAPAATASSTFKLANGQPTFIINGSGFTTVKNKTLTVEIVRGKSKFLLTRITVDNAGNLTRSLRLPDTTLRVGDTIQLKFGNLLIASGVTKQAKK